MDEKNIREKQRKKKLHQAKEYYKNDKTKKDCNKKQEINIENYLTKKKI